MEESRAHLQTCCCGPNSALDSKSKKTRKGDDHKLQNNSTKFKKQNEKQLGKRRERKGKKAMLPSCLQDWILSVLTSLESPGLYNSSTWGFQSITSLQLLKSATSTVAPGGVGGRMRSETQRRQREGQGLAQRGVATHSSRCLSQGQVTLLADN